MSRPVSPEFEQQNRKIRGLMARIHDRESGEPLESVVKELAVAKRLLAEMRLRKLPGELKVEETAKKAGRTDAGSGNNRPARRDLDQAPARADRHLSPARSRDGSAPERHRHEPDKRRSSPLDHKLYRGDLGPGDQDDRVQSKRAWQAEDSSLAAEPLARPGPPDHRDSTRDPPCRGRHFRLDNEPADANRHVVEPHRIA